VRRYEAGSGGGPGSRDPRGLLSSIRGAVRDDGVYLVLDIASEERLEDNDGPLGALKYEVRP
jgi:hypothetical protein